MKCKRCGGDFSRCHVNQKLCSDCKKIHAAEQNAIRYQEVKAGTRRAKPAFREKPDKAVVTKYKPKKKPVLITDKQQQELERKLRPKDYETDKGRILSEEEKAELIRTGQITHISLIRAGGLSESYSTGITAPMVGARRVRYPEQSGSIAL